MTKKQLYKLDFETAIEKLQEEVSDITDFSILKDFAIEKADEEIFYFAIHILKALQENFSSTYFKYDYSMGILDTPTPLETLEDLEQFCD